jgi:hypothetical protein
MIDRMLRDISHLERAAREAATRETPFASGAHAINHQDGGSDEISVAGLQGVLAQAQIPQGHHATHENGGSDQISVAGLSGVLATKQDADKLQGRAVDSTAPSDGQVLTWDNAGNKWKAAAAAAGGVAALMNQSGEVSTLVTSMTDTGVYVAVTVPAGKSVRVTCYCQYKVNNGTGNWRVINATTGYVLHAWGSASTAYTIYPYLFIDAAPGASTYTYKLQYQAGSGSGYRAYVKLASLYAEVIG